MRLIIIVSFSTLGTIRTYRHTEFNLVFPFTGHKHFAAHSPAKRINIQACKIIKLSGTQFLEIDQKSQIIHTTGILLIALRQRINTHPVQLPFARQINRRSALIVTFIRKRFTDNRSLFHFHRFRIERTIPSIETRCILIARINSLFQLIPGFIPFQQIIPQGLCMPHQSNSNHDYQ